MTSRSNSSLPIELDALNLHLPDFYINRELSQLEFNSRVLKQAQDPRVPLLERLKFLCISSTNLDEFFEIRVSGLKQRLMASAAPVGPDNIGTDELLREISKTAHTLVAEQYRTLNEDLIPALRREEITFLPRDAWSDVQRQWLEDYFHAEIEPVLSPTTLDPTRPIPRILNKSLCFIVSLHGNDVFGRSCTRAIVQAPRALPRLIRLPSSLPDTGDSEFIFLSSIIHAFIDKLFYGIPISGCYQFRVTRNSDLYVDEEEMDDLKRALEGGLFENRYGEAVRLEIAHNCPAELADFLLDHFELAHEDLYEVEGPVNLNRLLPVSSLVDRPELRDRPFVPRMPREFAAKTVFQAIAKQDILLHHPFDSFTPVIDFVQQAAVDPNVLAIKHTLYRTSTHSPIIENLVAAARAGKEVTVIIELRARFDEAANIDLATKLQEAGVHVVYGIVGYKTHCKMILVVRREGTVLRRYIHLGTGNYHPKTARLYTDYGLFSANEDLAEDVHQVFNQITSLMQTPRLKLLYQSPFTLHRQLLALIKRETEHARRGSTGHIIAKINALVEPEIIRALYEASMSGVLIDLIVRGVCCLRPGIPGVSESIRVRSIVSRFLEHTRCYYFHNDGDEEVFCASADWMDRNFFRRVEVMFPVLDAQLRGRLLADLDIYLSDNSQAWELRADGSYRANRPAPGERPVSAQAVLLAQYSESS